MIVIRAPVHWLGASAITLWPLVLVSPRLGTVQRGNILTHEAVHCEQQRRWATYGLGVGLLVWHLLYLLALPAWRNPWREGWEREAFRVCGFTDAEVAPILRQSPYWLWGIK